jgi:hypothetical protein
MKKTQRMAADLKQVLDEIPNDGRKRMVTMKVMTHEDRIRNLMVAGNWTREEAESVYQQTAVPLELGRLVLKLGLADQVRALAEQRVTA